MADTTKNKGWKIIAIIAGSLAGIWAIGWLITGKGNPLTWFATTPKEGDDCKDAEGKDGKLDASGNCVAGGIGQRVSISEKENLINQIVNKNKRLTTAEIIKIKSQLQKLNRQQLIMIINSNSSERTKCWEGSVCSCYDWLFNTGGCLGLL